MYQFRSKGPQSQLFQSRFTHCNKVRHIVTYPAITWFAGLTTIRANPGRRSRCRSGTVHRLGAQEHGIYHVIRFGSAGKFSDTRIGWYDAEVAALQPGETFWPSNPTWCLVLFFRSTRAWTSHPGLRRHANMAGQALLLSFLIGLFSKECGSQELGKLYAPRPPAGYAFVRIAASPHVVPAMRVKIGNADIHLADTAVASQYRAVPGGKPLQLSVGGAPVGEQLIPPPDQFATIVIAPSPSGFSGYLIAEGNDTSNELKAQLRFYNLVAHCEAPLKIAEGPEVFDRTTVGAVRSRIINPVQAKLESSCNDRSAAAVLPPLHSGDHYSLFLIDAGNGVALIGQFDATEPFGER